MPNDSLWIRRSLRGTLVHARVTPDGQLDTDAGGFVDVRYKPDGAAKIYRARASNLEVTPECEADRPQPIAEAPAAPAKPKARAASSSVKPGASDVIVWTDGACTGNPGPMGIGVVVILDGKREELGEYLGVGTNNIAELTAILRGLEMVARHADAVARPVFVHSDSAYAIGLLSQNWKAKANVELVAKLRRFANQFPHLHFVKVKGHSGVPDNERCDELATAAAARGR